MSHSTARAVLPALFAAALAFAAPASAAPETYDFDKGHTEVRFCWKHLGMSHQCASFTDYAGKLVIDKDNLANSKLDVTFKIDSVRTAIPLFDEHMRSAKLFDSAKFPEASFKSTKVEKTGDKTGKVTGDLTIRGITKPVTLDVTLNYEGPHPAKKTPYLAFSATTNVKRSDFGITYGVPAVSDNVDLSIETEMVKQ
jgi:polyisoprenoid-binding protein YceI